MKDERDDFGDTPVSYNRGFRTTRTERVQVKQEAPLIKARADHAPYSRRKPVPIGEPEEPTMIEDSQVLPEPQDPQHIIIQPEPEGAPKVPEETKVPKKVLRFAKSIRPTREVLDHRRLPGS